MPSRDLLLIVKAIDQATATLKNVGGAVGDLGADAKTAAQDMRPLGVALAAVGAAGAGLITTAALTAARVEVLGTVLGVVGKTAGYSQQELDTFEGAVAALGITTGASRQGLIQMMQAQLDLTEATGLASIAQDAAVIANVNSSQAYETLIRGILTGRTVLLKSLGLTVDFNAAYKAMAAQLDKTTGELTAQEKMQARLNEVKRTGLLIEGTYEAAMGDVGKKLTSMPRYLEEAALALGKAYLPAMEGAVDTTTDMLKVFIELDPEAQATIANFILLGTAITVPTGAAILLLPQLLAIGKSLVIVGGFAKNTAFAMQLLAAGSNTAGLGMAGFAASAATVAIPLAALYALMVLIDNFYQDHIDNIIETTESYHSYAINMAYAGREAHILSEAEWELARASEPASDGLENLVHETHRLNALLPETAQLTTDLTEATEDYGYEIDILKQAIAGPVKKVNEDYIEQVGDIRQAIRDETTTLQDLRLEHGEYDKAVLESQGKIDDLEGKLGELAGAHREAIDRILYDMVLYELGVDGMSEADAQFALDLALHMGLIDQEYYDMKMGVIGYFADIKEQGIEPHIEDIIAFGDQAAETTSQASLDYIGYQETLRDESRLILTFALNPINDALGAVPIHIRAGEEAAAGSGESIATGLHPGSVEAQILAGALLSIPANISSNIDIHTTYTETGTPPVGPWTPGLIVPPSPPPPPPPPPPPGGGGEQEFQHGTDYVPRTGLYVLHKGEAVIPAGNVRHGDVYNIQASYAFQSERRLRDDIRMMQLMQRA